LRYLAFFCANAKVKPLLPWKLFPLNLWHASAAKNQCAEFINQMILSLRIVVLQIGL
jgi:hypothetical protein